MTAATVLALDIGVSHSRGGVARADRPIGHGRVNTSPTGTPELLADLASFHDVVTEADAFDAVSLAVGGWVQPDTDVVRHAAALGAQNWHLAGAFADSTGHRPAVVADNLAAACAGEVFGAANLVVLAFGTGAGGKHAHDGHVVVGAAGLDGEVGHLTFRPAGPALRLRPPRMPQGVRGLGRHQRDLAEHEITLTAPATRPRDRVRTRSLARCSTTPSRRPGSPRSRWSAPPTPACCALAEASPSPGVPCSSTPSGTP